MSRYITDGRGHGVRVDQIAAWGGSGSTTVHLIGGGTFPLQIPSHRFEELLRKVQSVRDRETEEGRS